MKPLGFRGVFVLTDARCCAEWSRMEPSYIGLGMSAGMTLSPRLQKSPYE